MESEQPERNIYPNTCPAPGFRDVHCLWSVLTSPLFRESRRERSAEPRASFIGGADRAAEEEKPLAPGLLPGSRQHRT